MISKKKLSIVIVAGIGLATILLLAIVLAVKTVNKQRTNNKKSTSHSLVLSKSATESGSTIQSDNTKTSPTQSSSSLSQKEALEQFLEVYSSWKLENSSIDSRANKLQDLMTSTAYQNNYISDDAQHLKDFLSNYQKTKQINTSNSTLLVSRQYSKSNIYLDANKDNQYYVELYYTETPVYQSSGYTIEAKYNISMIDNQVNNISLLNQQSVMENK